MENQVSQEQELFELLVKSWRVIESMALVLDGMTDGLSEARPGLLTYALRTLAGRFEMPIGGVSREASLSLVGRQVPDLQTVTRGLATAFLEMEHEGLPGVALQDWIDMFERRALSLVELMGGNESVWAFAKLAGRAN